MDEQGLSKQGKEYHSHLLSLRNKFVAHAGISMYEKIEFNIGIGTDGHLVTNANPIMYKVLGVSEGEFEEKLISLLKEVKDKISKKINKLEVNLQDEINSMEYNQTTRDYIIKKIFNRSGVSQLDIDHIAKKQ
jgi:hypothetical protein